MSLELNYLCAWTYRGARSLVLLCWPNGIQAVGLPFNPQRSVSRSVKSDSAIPWTAAHQGPLSMGFPRQEYWSRLPFPSPGDLSNSGTEPKSPASQADSLPPEPLGKTHPQPEATLILNMPEFLDTKTPAVKKLVPGP